MTFSSTFSFIHVNLIFKEQVQILSLTKLDVKKDIIDYFLK